MVNAENKHRILHIVSAMNRGGAESLLMNVHRNVDTSKIQFDYVSHSIEKDNYNDEIVSLGGQIYKIRSLGQSGPISYIQQLKAIMANTKYTAVHAHTDYQTGLAALAAKLAGVDKRICHSHSNNWGRDDGLKQKLLLKALRTVIRYAATDYCACSIEAGRFLFGRAADQGKVHMLKNGIEINRFTAVPEDCNSSVRLELNIPAQSRIIGHVGHFSHSKNHRFLLKILRRLLDEGQDFVAILVGVGPLKQAIEEEAAMLGLGKHIRFLGVRSDVPKLMKAFDVLLFPSLFEGFGIVTLEAQGCGTPCIAADTVPRTTDLGLGLMSFLSLDAPVETWTQEIAKCLCNVRPDERQITTHFVRSGFDIKQSIQQWMSIYGVS